MRHLLALPALIAAVPAGAQTIPPYKALGTEPFWALSIGETMRLDQPGRPPVIIASPEPRPSFNGLRYVTPLMTVDVTRTPCSDGMSDRRYPDRVTVTIGNHSLRGCGGTATGGATSATMRLDGTRWSIAAIDGRPVRSDRPASVRFEDGRISGNAGCNNFGGDYRLERGRLTVGAVISTRMACPGPGMQTETRFLRLLGGPVQIRWEGKRTLVLRARTGSATLVSR